MTLRYCEPELRRLLSRLDARGDGSSLVACHLAMALDAVDETASVGWASSDTQAPANAPDSPAD